MTDKARRNRPLGDDGPLRPSERTRRHLGPFHALIPRETFSYAPLPDGELSGDSDVQDCEDILFALQPQPAR